MKLNLKLGELYEVYWHDAYGGASWRQHSDVLTDGPFQCYTVGYYLGKNKAGDLMFAGTLGCGEEVCQVAARPAGMVKSVVRLKRMK